MNAEIFAALAQLEKERGIPQQYMIDNARLRDGGWEYLREKAITILYFSESSGVVPMKP